MAPFLGSAEGEIGADFETSLQHDRPEETLRLGNSGAMFHETTPLGDADMFKFLVRLALGAVGLALAAPVVPGVSYDTTTTLVLAALLLGVVNAIVRPILVILTLPLTIITLGLFLLVLNAGMILLVAFLLKGFVVQGLMAGVLAAIVTGLANWVGAMVIGDLTPRRS